jgi:hypothetical protein
MPQHLALITHNMPPPHHHFSPPDIYFDRAKLAAKLLVKPLPPPPEGVAEGSKEAEAAAQAASAAATREALTKIKVRGEHVQQCWVCFVPRTVLVLLACWVFASPLSACSCYLAVTNVLLLLRATAVTSPAGC